jgi:hypothetical protein
MRLFSDPSQRQKNILWSSKKRAPLYAGRRATVSPTSRSTFNPLRLTLRAQPRSIQIRTQPNKPVFLSFPGFRDYTPRPMKKKSSANKQINLRPHSSILVDGPERAAARAMLYPAGFKPHFNSTAISR